MPGGGEAGDVALTSAAGSTVVTSTFTGTSSISSVARTSGALRVLDCPLGDQADPAPSYFEMPIQFSVGGRMGTYAGASIGCSGVVAVSVFSCWLWMILQSRRTVVAESRGEAQPKGPFAFKVCCAIASSCLMYLGPNSCGAATTVLSHGDDSLHFVLAVATYFLNLASALLLFHGIWKLAPQTVSAVPQPCDDDAQPEGQQQQLQSGSRMKFAFVPKSDTTSSSSSTDSTTFSSEELLNDNDSFTSATSDTSSRSSTTSSTASSPKVATKKPLVGPAWWFMAFYGPLFDATRDFNKPSVRCYMIPEFVSSCLVQIIVGVRPSSGCSDAAFAVVLVSTVMFAYLAVVKPYRTRLDMFFSLALNALQAMMITMMTTPASCLSTIPRCKVKP